MTTNHEVYIKSEQVNNLINEHINATVINENNAMRWLLYVRTIRTTIDIIEAKANGLLGQKEITDLLYKYNKQHTTFEK